MGILLPTRTVPAPRTLSVRTECAYTRMNVQSVLMNMEMCMRRVQQGLRTARSTSVCTETSLSLITYATQYAPSVWFTIQTYQATWIHAAENVYQRPYPERHANWKQRPRHSAPKTRTGLSVSQKNQLSTATAKEAATTAEACSLASSLSMA